MFFLDHQSDNLSITSEQCQLYYTEVTKTGPPSRISQGKRATSVRRGRHKNDRTIWSSTTISLLIYCGVLGWNNI